MSKIALPDANAPMVDKATGAPTAVYRKWFDSVANKLWGGEKATSSQGEQLAVEGGGWLIEYPDDKDYLILLNWPYAVEISSITTKCVTGSCTLTAKINATPLGGAANSVSTSEQVQAHDTDNLLNVGDDLVLTVSSNSGCEGLSVTIAGTRVLAS